ncbi:MAG: recombinase family protein [Clostridium sp.]|nr:recombinase family protein [Clostridium sp.]
MGNIYSYQRISTKESTDKQSFKRQDKSIKKYAEDMQMDILLEFNDDCSGKDFNRPQWKKLESIVKNGDTIIFKDVSRFTRQANEGYEKYMDLMNKGVNLIFIDNPTISTDYIKNLTNIANSQELVTKTALEGTIKLLLIVELDRVQKEREIFIQRVRQGIQASEKKSGRKQGTLDKMSDELREDIKLYINDRSIKQVDLMKKHSISRNTLKKYVEILKSTI